MRMMARPLAATLTAFLLAGISIETQAPQPSWTQWGGPTRDFMAPSTGLADSWPASGPRRLWTRPLGEGHSAILADNGRLYAHYRPISTPRSQEEVVVAMEAATGKTIWEYRYPSSTAGADFSEGAGPHATPLMAGNRLFAVGSRRQLMALDKTTGKLLWSRDLIKDYGAPGVDRGMSNSPLFHDNTILLPIGSRGQAIGAFNPDNGALLWKAGRVDYSPASPILIDVDGQKQIVLFGGERIAGHDPANGNELWNHPHRTDWGLNISTPVWTPADHTLLFSSAYGTGSRALELRQTGGKTTVKEKWASNRVRVHIGTIIRVGDTAYMSSGDFGPAFLTAVNMSTGAVRWQDRSFARAQLLYADNKLIVLDEDGTLAIASVSADGFKVLSRAAILSNLAWTPPTLVGRTLYVRDRKTIAAYDLS